MVTGSHPFDPVEGGQRKGNHCEMDKYPEEVTTTVMYIHLYPLHIYFHDLSGNFGRKVFFSQGL